MRIFVDADACPRACLEELETQAGRVGMDVTTIASFHHQMNRQPHIVVDDGPDAVDWAIVNRARGGDLVVTQDTGLAAVLLAKGVKVISPTGYVYSAKAADQALEERALKARFRRSGGRTRGPAPRVWADNTRFAENLKTLMGATTEDV